MTKHLIKLFICIFFLTGIYFKVSAQQVSVINEFYDFNFKKNVYLCFDSYWLDAGGTSDIKFVHTSLKPCFKNTSDDSSLLRLNVKDAFHYYLPLKTRRTWFGRKLFNENFINVKDDNFLLAVNPLFNFTAKHTFGDSSKNYIQNTRGLELKGQIGTDLYFETSYYENQTSFVPYVKNFIETYAVVPGAIRVKDFKSASYDYGVAYGLLSYSPGLSSPKQKNILNFQIGSGKNFFGDGYRSLLLSDFSSPYPFLKITEKFKKISYTCLYTSFQNIFENHVLPYDTIEWNASYQKKTGTFHYLSYYAGNRLNLSLFEGTLWQVADSGGHHFSPDFFNPLILFHTAEFGLNGKNNTLIGLNALYKLFNKIHFYGQLAIDDIRLKKITEKGYFDNRYGIQIGAEGFDLFGIKNLNIQAEYNQAQPYMYSHSRPMQSYTHYNQPLAHPLGANFTEGIGILRYNYKKCYLRIQFNNAVYGSDGNSFNMGKDIFQSDLTATEIQNDTIGHGIRTTLRYADVCFSYLLNPMYNINIFVGGTYRNEKNIMKNESDKFIYFGIRTSILNEYFDF
jgi:hypothetical protein